MVNTFMAKYHIEKEAVRSTLVEIRDHMKLHECLVAALKEEARRWEGDEEADGDAEHSDPKSKKKRRGQKRCRAGQSERYWQALEANR